MSNRLRKYFLQKMQKLSTKPHPAVLKKTQNTCKKSKIVVEVVHIECGVQTSSVCQHTDVWDVARKELWRSAGLQSMHLQGETGGLLECCSRFHHSAEGIRQ